MLPTPPSGISRNTDRGDDLAHRGDTDTELGLRLDSRGDDRRPHLHRAIAAWGRQRAVGQLVVAGVVDRPMVIRYHGLAGTMTYRSFHAAAKWTFGEGERMLRRVRYRQPPEGVFLGSGTGKKCVSSPMADDMESLAANRRKAEAPPPAIETRRCDGCDADFRPGRPWSRFCCPACRLWAHRRLAGVTGAQELATIFKSDPR